MGFVQENIERTILFAQENIERIIFFVQENIGRQIHFILDIEIFTEKYWKKISETIFQFHKTLLQY